ncbi:DUF4837 family protein [Olleya marilimosa]|uniref:DUF4837 family protein n=1 Tax=Olleya marilimosa TaxID=272164 RepID=A0ABR8LSE3_9FLAO|nr:DUF4837 family protein [Olleya marilimosa]MBD3863121.1 DUF4837 family protein [Olleya marilimosa]MBD3890619.1 DUF4837 family protein [Olleya marilimosa]|tara:strand:+ start:234 stop:1211 length:978 start_codon:yes stop_codon:yes gene_type:complete
MKKLAVLIVLVCTILSCNEGTKQNQRMVPKSSGNLYNVSVVVDNELWNGNVGDAIRDVLTTVVPGLPQPEPMFDINQIPPQVFSGFAAKNRIVLKIEKSDKSEIKIATDAYAQPQKVIVVSGPNDTKLIEVLKDNKDKILDTFKNQEIEARQALTNNSLHTNNNIEKKLGISIKFPSIYRIAKEDGDFFWVRKNLTTGTNNFMVYQVPLDAIDKEGDITQQIITIRDSVGKKYIPGPIDGSYMKTEEAYTPFLFTTIIDNKPTYEVRSTWDIEGTYNAGPFVNYMVEDKINNRYVVLEGFTFAPSVNKRDYILELESIIKSLKIN